jgi:hypothetical protein
MYVQHAIILKKQRYEKYLKLKEEFENDLQ